MMKQRSASNFKHLSCKSLCWTVALTATVWLSGATSAAAQDQLLVPTGAVWKYLDNGSNPGTAWRNPGFPDGNWDSGPAQLGYGDGDETTVVSYGSNPNNKYITTYFRHTFMMDEPPNMPLALLSIQRDDGAVVYLNGTEIFRTNMPEGPIGYLTIAASTVGGAEENAFFDEPVDAGLLALGENVLAVEIHQRSATSSDISFDLQLLVPTELSILTRGPYLQRGTATSVVLRWRTFIPTDSMVAYGLSFDNLDQQVTDGESTTEHEITLTDLQPGATYYYSVGSSAEVLAGANDQHFFVTAPTIGQAVPARVWVIGDSGTANADAAAVRDAYLDFTLDQRTDVWLMLGDNAYNDGTDPQYQAAVFDMYPDLLKQTVVWPTLGNHDGHSADSPTESGVYYDVFTLPRDAEAGGLASGTEAYYSFDYGRIHFICLDSYDTDRSADGAMMTWLQADLADTLADWVIAYWHHPPYSKGSHDSDSEGALIDMREIALPILENGGVDLVLCGHSHSYERSFLLDGHYGTSDTLIPAMILDGGDGKENGAGAYSKPSIGTAAHEGAVYVVAGSSGKTSTMEPVPHPAMYISLEELGSLVLDIDGQRLDATFLDDAGQIRDTFTMLKGPVCFADLNGDGQVAIEDLSAVLAAWGACANCSSDLNADGQVDAADLADVLGAWGPCP